MFKEFFIGILRAIALCLFAIASLLPSLPKAQTTPNTLPNSSNSDLYPKSQESTEDLEISGSDTYSAALQAISQGNKQLAQLLLEKVIQEIPEHAGAWLDLALLYCELGDERFAFALLERIESELRPPKNIRVLINQVRVQGCGNTKKWINQVQVKFGHSSNVNFAPTSEVIRFAPSAPFRELSLAPSERPRADTHISADLLWVLPAQFGNWFGAEWQATVQTKLHQELKSFDSQIGVLGATWRDDFQNGALWQDLGIREWEISANASHWILGGQAFETSTQVWGSTWSHRWGRSHQFWRWGFEGGLTHYNYPGSSRYDSLRLDTRVKLHTQLKAVGVMHSGLFSLGPIQDKPLNHRPGGERTGYTVHAQWGLGNSINRQFVVFFQHQNVKEREAYSTLFFGNINRNPRHQIIGFQYQHALQPKCVLLLGWQYQRTNDQLEIFSHKNQQVNVGFRWSF